MSLSANQDLASMSAPLNWTVGPWKKEGNLDRVRGHGQLSRHERTPAKEGIGAWAYWLGQLVLRLFGGVGGNSPDNSPTSSSWEVALEPMEVATLLLFVEVDN